MEKDLELKLSITADGEVAVEQLGRVDDSLADVGEAGEDAGERASDALAKIKAAAAAIGLVALAREFVQLNAATESQRLALTQLTGSAESAGDAMAYLGDLGDRLGVSTLDLGEQFVGLAAATKGTALEGQATRDVFESVVAAMAKLGKSSAETTRALAAVQQMASKGVVAAEEMRGQLGEALPGAMQALSKSTGIAVEDLNAMMESGQLMAADVLPALAEGLRDMTGEVERVDSLAAAMGRLQNAMTRAFTEPGQSGLSDAFARIINLGTEAVNGITAGTVALGKNLGALGAYVSGAIPDWQSLAAAIEENNAAGQAYIDNAAAMSAATEDQSKALQGLASEALKAAQAYAEALDAAKASAATTKEAGAAALEAAKAEQARAVLLRDEGVLLAAKATSEQAAADAITRNAQAAQAIADVTRARIATLDAEIGKLLEQATAEGTLTTQIQAAITAREKQIEERQKELSLQDAQAEKIAQEALAQEAAAQAARIAAATYGDQSAALGELLTQRDRLRAAITAEGEASAAAAPLLAALAEVNARIADAAQDAAAGIDLAVAAIGRELELTQARATLAGAELTLDQDRARARGDLAEASRIGVELMQVEVDLAKASAEAKEREAAQLAEKARLMQIAAEATGEYTREEQAAVAALEQAAQLAEIEAEAMAIGAKAKREAMIAAEQLANQQRVLSEAMREAGITGVESMEDVRAAIERLASGGDLEALGTALEEAFRRGVLGAEEYKQALEEVKERQEGLKGDNNTYSNILAPERLAETFKDTPERLREYLFAWTKNSSAVGEISNAVQQIWAKAAEQSGAQASSTSATTTRPGGGLQTYGPTVNVNVAGVLDINDRASLDTLARKLKPILGNLSRLGSS